ncbi:hypothetical protein D047_0354B, partial [Vibrio parahaemolyticus VPTS-2010_2]
ATALYVQTVRDL